FQIRIDMENPLLNLNGTRTYTYSSSFDEDGVLLNMEFTSLTNWFNENITYDVTTRYQLNRVGGPPAAGGFDLGMAVPLYAAIAIIPVFLIIGLLLGKRIWG
ncbi:MAG: hypothetical protein ACFE7R_01815, partial [Candidatus Hodarchaeota archaeon]